MLLPVRETTFLVVQLVAQHHGQGVIHSRNELDYFCGVVESSCYLCGNHHSLEVNRIAFAGSEEHSTSPITKQPVAASHSWISQVQNGQILRFKCAPIRDYPPSLNHILVGIVYHIIA